MALVPLYRALMHAARAYDRDPALRMLLAATRSRGYDGESWRPLPEAESAAALSAVLCGTAVREALGGARLYAPHHAKSSNFRPQLRAALRGSGEDPRLPDAGFALLRWLDGGISVGSEVLLPPQADATAVPSAPVRLSRRPWSTTKARREMSPARG